MKNKTLNNGFKMPEIWIWTLSMWWHREKDLLNDDKNDIESIKYAIDLWINYIDTAEIYASWYSEILLWKAIKDYKREKLIISSKVRWSNASYNAIKAACKNSLQRLGINYLDIYYIHRRDVKFSLKDCILAMNELINEWLVKNIWVSNFSKKSLIEAQSYTENKIVANQVHYNLIFREAEKDWLLKYCQENDVFLVAYRPLELWKLAKTWNWIMLEIAKKYSKKHEQIALNRLLSQKNVIPIFTSKSKDHIKNNFLSSGWSINKSDLEYARENYKWQIFSSDVVTLS